MIRITHVQTFDDKVKDVLPRTFQFSQSGLKSSADQFCRCDSKPKHVHQPDSIAKTLETMAEDPGRDSQETVEREGMSWYLELLEKSPSENATAVILRKKLVPWIQNNGTSNF